MKSKNDYQLIVVLIFASIALALVTMTGLSSVRLGLDFGKDTRVIVGVEDEPQFMSFTRDLQFNHAQTRLRVTEGGIFILDVSGVQSGSEFEKMILSENPSAEILLSGTFGSMTKYLNNQSFVTMCLSVFIILLGIYYIARYHLAGWYYWLMGSLLMMTSILIIMAFGLAFTQTMWYALLISFFVQFSLITLDYRENKNLILSVLTCLVGLGVFLMSAVHFPYFSTGLYLFTFGVLSLIFYWIHGLLFEDMIRSYLSGRIFPLSDLFEVEDERSIVYSRTLSAILVLVLVGGLLSLSRGQVILNTTTSNLDNVLVFNSANSATYLEVQARLSKLDLFDRQIDYRVSEQGQTWLEFDDSVTVEELSVAANDLSIGLDLEVSYYQALEERFVSSDWLYLMVIIGIVLVGMTLIYSKHSVLLSLWYGGVSILSYGIFIVFTSMFNLVDGFSWLLMALVLPLILLLILLPYVSGAQTSFRKFYVEGIIASASAMLLMSLPVLIIFPVANNAEMMLVFLVLLLSLHAAMGAFSWFVMKRGNDDA